MTPSDPHPQLRSSCVAVQSDLWIGGDLAPLPAEVRTVVSLDAATPRLEPGGVVEHRHPFRDTRWEPAPRGPLEQAVAAVVQAAGAVLVRCRHGINRSALVVCLALSARDHLDPQATIDLVRRQRPGALTNPYFAEFVRRYPQEPMR